MGEISDNCCGGCGSPVFQAEGVPAGEVSYFLVLTGHKFNKNAFKCMLYIQINSIDSTQPQLEAQAEGSK